ncbi:MAG: hypothetical protein WCH99_08675 [Verrucomicrobiota bacterium]
MDFLKKNYEKILLGLVLTGLIGVLAFMLFYISGDKAEMEQKRKELVNPPVKALPALDLVSQSNVVARLQTPVNLDLEASHKLFNPLEWQLGLDSNLVKAVTKTGLKVVVVSGITPLNLNVSFDSVITNTAGALYVIGVERQAAPVPYKRRKQPYYVTMGDKPNDTFALVEVKGPAENPDSLSLKLLDTGEVVSIARGKPFVRVDGYLADFRYDPEKKVFKAQRKGDKVSFGGGDYLVFEVNQNELVLSDQSNQKKTPLPFKP